LFDFSQSHVQGASVIHFAKSLELLHCQLWILFILDASSKGCVDSGGEEASCVSKAFLLFFVFVKIELVELDNETQLIACLSLHTATDRVSVFAVRLLSGFGLSRDAKKAWSRWLVLDNLFSGEDVPDIICLGDKLQVALPCKVIFLALKYFDPCFNGFVGEFDASHGCKHVTS
jgi:hypothetical protein